MGERAFRLMNKADRQLGDLAEFLATLDETELAKAEPKRPSKTLGDAAAHLAEGYHFMGGFLAKEGYAQGPSTSMGHGHGQRLSTGLADMRRRLDDAKSPIASLASLTDEQLDSVPPVRSSRFSDGQRTLEQVIEAVIAHQEEHLADLKAAVA